MSFLSTLLSRSQHQVPTRQALMVVGLQNDFTSPDGKLPVNNATGYLERIQQLVPTFREHGEIFWIRTEYRENRPVNDPSGSGCMVIANDDYDSPTSGDDMGSGAYSSRPSVRSNSRINDIVQCTMDRAAERGLDTVSTPEVDQDLFLSQSDPQNNCCLPGSWGAELSPEVRDLVSSKDVQVVKSFYSAFTSSSLLLMLRAKFITELYVVGCTTNLSVYATALDAAQHGLTINLVEDCLNYRHKHRHERAIQRLVDIMGASVTTSGSVMSRLRGDMEADEQGVETNPDIEVDDQTGPVGDPSAIDSFQRHVGTLTLSETPTLGKQVPQLAPTQHAESTGSESPNATSPRVHPSPRYQRRVRSEDDTQDLNVQPGSNDAQDVIGVRRVSPEPRSQSVAKDEGNEATVAHSTPILVPRHSPDFPHLGTDDETGSTMRFTATEDQNPIAHRSHDLALKAGQPPAEILPPTRVVRKPQVRRKDKSNLQKNLGPGDAIGNGGSKIVYDLLEPPFAEVVFQQLFYEVHWQRMYHSAGEVPRLVCCQGDIDSNDGSMPVYRHPADQTLSLLRWNPTVAKIKREVEERVGHKLNHVLIQLYRSGQDYISEHSDKTLDIVPGSNIVNVSIGAERTMRLRTKRGASNKSSGSSPAKSSLPTNNTTTSRTQKEEDQTRARTTQRIPMPHNSMFVMDLDTNGTWLHGINQDKRLLVERSNAELAYGGMRISLTFRQIGTFLSSDSRLIWGQGALAKKKEEANPTVNGVQEESQKLINAFGFENQSTSFDWEASYGAGFDVLHMKTGLPEKESSLFLLAGNVQSDLPVRLFLTHLGVPAEEITPPSHQLTSGLQDASGKPLPPSLTQRKPCFRDAGPLHVQIEGVTAILLFLDHHHAPPSSSPSSQLQKAKEIELLTSPMLQDLRTALSASSKMPETALQPLEDDLVAQIDASATDDREKEQGNTEDWLAGADFGIADCLFWPLIKEAREQVLEFSHSFSRLEAWALRLEEKENSIGQLG